MVGFIKNSIINENEPLDFPEISVCIYENTKKMMNYAFEENRYSKWTIFRYPFKSEQETILSNGIKYMYEIKHNNMSLEEFKFIARNDKFKIINKLTRKQKWSTLSYEMKPCDITCECADCRKHESLYNLNTRGYHIFIDADDAEPIILCKECILKRIEE